MKKKKNPVLGAVIKVLVAVILFAGLGRYEETLPMVVALVLAVGLLVWAVLPFVKARKGREEAEPEEYEDEPWRTGPDDVEYPFTLIKPPQALGLEDFIVLDTETTGFSPRDDKIIEIAALKIRNGAATWYHSLVDPQRRIPKRSKAIHHITDEDVAGAPAFAQILPELDAFLDRDLPIVGQNVHYDLRMLWWAYHDAGAELAPRAYADTYKLAKKAFPGRASYALASLIHDYGLIEGEQMHRAESDVEATLALYRLCCEKLASK